MTLTYNQQLHITEQLYTWKMEMIKSVHILCQPFTFQHCHLTAWTFVKVRTPILLIKLMTFSKTSKPSTFDLRWWRSSSFLEIKKAQCRIVGHSGSFSFAFSGGSSRVLPYTYKIIKCTKCTRPRTSVLKELQKPQSSSGLQDHLTNMYTSNLKTYIINSESILTDYMDSTFHSNHWFFL